MGFTLQRHRQIDGVRTIRHVDKFIFMGAILDGIFYSEMVFAVVAYCLV